MSFNPYSDNQPQSLNEFQSTTPNASEDGYLRQVPVLGVLNIVQASLELLMCLMLIGMSALMVAAQNSPKIQTTPNAATIQIMGIGYGIFGAVVGLFAILRLTSGILILKRRGRIFSIVTSMIGLVSVFTCYCAPTSLAIAIYSLVVLIQPSVIVDFDRNRTTLGAN
jgi:hypothetical protein